MFKKKWMIAGAVSAGLWGFVASASGGMRTHRTADQGRDEMVQTQQMPESSPSQSSDMYDVGKTRKDAGTGGGGMGSQTPATGGAGMSTQPDMSGMSRADGGTKP